MSSTTIATARSARMRPRLRRRFLTGAATLAVDAFSSVSGGAPGSGVTLAPRNRRPPAVAALVVARFVQPGQEPGHQFPASDRAARAADREPDQDEDRDGPQALVQPVPGEYSCQHCEEQNETDLGKQGYVAVAGALSWIVHRLSVKAP